MKRIATIAMRLLIALAVVLVVLGLAWGVFRWQVIQPRKEFEKRVTYGKGEIPDAELRDVCHRCIRWTKHHDSFIFLTKVGDEGSLPYLIRALGRMDDVQMCTKDHCVDALEAISGEKFGEDADAWKRWFEER